MQTADKKMLTDAIARNAGIVLSLPGDDKLRHHKSRFLAVGDDGFWIESPHPERDLVGNLIGLQKPCGVSFKHGHTKVIFGAPLLRHDATYPWAPGATCEAVFMGFPNELKTIQRRGSYRVLIPPDADLKVRIWRMLGGVPLRDKPMNRLEITAELKDISTGGIGAILTGNEDQPPKVTPADRLRIAIRCNGTEILVEGRLRYPTGPLTSPSVRAGIAFASLDRDMDGRQTHAMLTRIVGELTRAELRRMRMGLTTTTT